MGRISIADTLAIRKREGYSFFNLPKAKGSFTLILRDVRTGKPVTKIEKTNLVTRLVNEHMYSDQTNLGNKYIFLSNDTRDAHPRNSVYMGTFYNDSAITATDCSINTTSRTWTWNQTISPPSAGYTRTFQTVGLCKTRDEESGANVYYMVIAATKLSSALTQDETQSVEVSYRLAWERG